MNSNPAPWNLSACHASAPQPTSMTLSLPYILNWSCSELGLSLHPLHQTTLWLFLLMYTNIPICCVLTRLSTKRWIHPCCHGIKRKCRTAITSKNLFISEYLPGWSHHFLDLHLLTFASDTRVSYGCVRMFIMVFTILLLFDVDTALINYSAEIHLVHITIIISNIKRKK